MDVSYAISSYINTLNTAYLLSPIFTFIAGAIIGVIVYYTVGAKYGIKKPKFIVKAGDVLCKIHLPMFLAVLLYLFFLICQFWRVRLIMPEYSSYDYISPRVLQCFSCCYLNPWFYVWAATVIAAVVLAILGFKRKIPVSIAYIVIGISFMPFYGFTYYGTLLYSQSYCDAYNLSNATQIQVNQINHSCAALTIIVGVIYILCALLLAFLTRKKKAIETEKIKNKYL